MSNGMEMAINAAKMSDDPDTQVGVVIYQGALCVVSGANRLAPNVRRFRDRTESPHKYDWIGHAEVGAIASAAVSGTSLLGSAMYTTLFPCAGCANAIVRAGVTRLFYLEKRPNPAYGTDAAEMILREGGVKVAQEVA